MKTLFPFFIIAFCSIVISCNVADNGVCKEDCFIESGIASWYGFDYPPRCTANGETYDREAFTAAHKSLPFNTILRAKNIDNGKSVIVRINDRGPFIPRRVIDLSEIAADEIGLLSKGLVDVELYLVKESNSPEPDFSQGCKDL